jgi:hypothetical protein
LGADDRWETEFGWLGQSSKTIQCKESDVEQMVREVQVSFYTTSNWQITARPAA